MNLRFQTSWSTYCSLFADPASGTSIDYMLSRKIPYTYGIELRPEDNETDIGFDIPATSIQPAGHLQDKI